MELLSKTGIKEKNPGDKFTASELNILNSCLNNSIEAANSLLSTICDINRESGELTRKFNLTEAIRLVPSTRRVLGLKIRFLNTFGRYSEYSYLGEVTDSSEWTNVDNWLGGLDILDGGIW